MNVKLLAPRHSSLLLAAILLTSCVVVNVDQPPGGATAGDVTVIVTQGSTEDVPEVVEAVGDVATPGLP